MLNYPRMYWRPLSVLLACTALSLCLALLGTPVDHLDTTAVISESFMVLLPVVGMFLIHDLRRYSPETFGLLMTGLACITLSMVTDAMDELFTMNKTINALFEDLLEVVGFGLFLIGLQRWAAYNQAIQSQLKSLATTDALTGTNNRRHFVAALETEASRTHRHDSALSVILLDIDHFKKVNDTFGHDVGDAVLIHVAKLLKGQLRATDIFARYGGEEFVVLAPHTDINGAIQLAEKLRSTLECNPPPALPAVTASFGAAQYSTSEPTDHLLIRVDRALYAAKADGRNRVCQAP